MLRAVAEAMFWQDGGLPDARLEAHLAQVDAYVSAASRPVRAGLRLALLVVRLAPLMLLASVRPLERLDVDTRVEVLARLERHAVAGLCLAFVGWRAILTMIVYEHPDELRALGYSHARSRHTRALPVLQPTLVDTPRSVGDVAPAPEESGVRIANPDSDAAQPAAAVAQQHREVA